MKVKEGRLSFNFINFPFSLFHFILDMEELIEKDDFRRFDLLLASDKKNQIMEMRSWYDETLLHISVGHDKLEMTKQLVKTGADVNCTDKGGDTCAHIASLSGSVTCLRYVCQHLPHLLNLQNNYGETCLHYAVCHHHLPSVRMLLEPYVDFRVRNKEGRTALDVAKHWNIRHIVEELEK